MKSRRLSILGQDAVVGAAPSGPVVWQTGFRPFFLLAGAAAVLLAPAWVAGLTGALALPAALGPVTWHAHEMLFGFALAVLAAFLLTAAQVWTGRGTVSGRGLVALGALWLAARLLPLLGPNAVVPAAVVNVAFPIAVAVGIAPALLAAKSRRNYPFLGLLALLTAASVAIWGEVLGAWTGARSAASWVALDVVVTMIVIVGGRIVPMFTKNGTGAAVRDRNLLDPVAVWSMGPVICAHALVLDAAWLGPALVLAGGANLARMAGWATPAALRVPLVGVLHAGYALTAAGLLLEGALLLTPWGALHLGRHVTAIGGVSVMCMGMMTRVTLGHTGRALHPPRGTTALYAAIVAAAGARTAAPLLPEAAVGLFWTAGILFSAAFGGYLALYARILVSPRPDGKPG